MTRLQPPPSSFNSERMLGWFRDFWKRVASGAVGGEETMIIELDANGNFTQSNKSTSKLLEDDDVLGTTDEIEVTIPSEGTVVIGIVDPLITTKGGTGLSGVTENSLLHGGPSTSLVELGVANDGEIIIGSTGSPPALNTITGTDNQVVVSNGSNTITLSLPQDIHTAATPTFADMYLSPMVLDENTTYKSLNDFFKLFTSVGRISGGLITDAGSEAIDVEEGTGVLRIADDDVSQIVFFDWDLTEDVAIATDTTKYVGIEYNSGSPQVVIKTSQWDWDLDTDFPLGSVVNEGGTLHILNNPWWISDGLTNLIERINALGHVVYDSHFGGLLLSVVGTRNISVTEGKLWTLLNEHTIDAIDTSGTDTVEYYWYNGVAGTWNDSDVSQFSVTQWNDTTAAALQNITSNWYANIWVYAETDDDKISLIYPQAQYPNVGSAEIEEPPSLLPEHISKNGILIGRILIKQNTNTPIEVQSAFLSSFALTASSDHGNLSGLGDDDHTQYHNDSRALTWLQANHQMSDHVDVETGTWTPSYVPHTGDDFTSVTYDTARYGSYVKIGNLVWVSCMMRTDAIDKGTATGSAAIRVSGLPYNTENNAATRFYHPVGRGSDFAGDQPVAIYAPNNAGYVLLCKDLAGAYVDVDDMSTVANDNYISFSFMYRTGE